MKKLFYLIAFAGTTLLAQSCNNSSKDSADGADSTEMATTTDLATDTLMTSPDSIDVSFANQAAVGGMAEVEFGQLALQKASNTKVKEFAAMMVKDHSKANEELKSIAADKNIQLPTELDAEHKKVKEDLEGKSGAAFDKAYAKAMVDGHQKTLALMQNGSTNNNDAELKAFAGKTAPVVKHHLDMILKIEAEVK